jgi:hypothetical protein
MNRANAEGSQLDRSQRGIGVGDGCEDKDVRELLKWLIPLLVLEAEEPLPLPVAREGAVAGAAKELA